ncbi:FAD-dependent oxidoreductase [Saliterribacillus persicus]|uniref:NADPH-dependent L-lysine 6-monooxygenase-like protein n=1 Tax=Saliterribacillus persicus TaxID=930114 RepID=A0A368XD42_9BACI|nr:FAD/NAD(P)-binding protein [Saliterribacillus persicus]RCW65883.1 NADPH-dependent L-lysine 6-monooxygenase-like protein [Saliterribacillus persicus]
MYKWIIIGGGIHGCCIANRLLKEKICRKDLLIIDAYPEPMHVWRSLTEKIGMDYLRSPSVHHIAQDPFSLKEYAHKFDYAQPFKGRYRRPRLDMFNQHSIDEMDEVNVRECWKQGIVNWLKRSDGVWEVSLFTNEVIQAEHVVLAMGVNRKPQYPQWFSGAEDKKHIRHIFDQETVLPEKGDVFVLGGGMTAAHLAHTLARKSAINSVTILKRHPFRINNFDSDPGWLGPKYLRNFYEVDCYEKRRKLIQEARHRGSITSELYVKLKKQVKAGRLRFYTGELEKVKCKEDIIEIQMDDGERLVANTMLLATGAKASMPGEKWLTPVIKKLNLPCAPCGFPVVAPSLEWKQKLYVAGALAELEIGPTSRNIAGARKTADRIAQNA